jgi:predicted RecA/RadA family phage recombinase
MWGRLSTAMVCVGIAFGAAAEDAKKGENGGEVVVMEGHPIEFVAKGQVITFYILEDDGKSPTPTTGFSGRAVVQDAGKTFAVALSSAEPNKFVGQLAAPLGPKARVVLSAKVPGHTLQARFTTD